MDNSANTLRGNTLMVAPCLLH